jgi:hypothetical protein
MTRHTWNSTYLNHKVNVHFRVDIQDDLLLSHGFINQCFPFLVLANFTAVALHTCVQSVPLQFSASSIRI